LSAILAKGGHLILSGITLDQIRIVRAAYRNRGLFPVRTLRIGNWATLVLQK
jgi:ribosomal protein L11 methylase PrmA